MPAKFFAKVNTDNGQNAQKSLGFGALAMNCCFATCATQNQPKN
jgi:hypothetical protein